MVALTLDLLEELSSVVVDIVRKWRRYQYWPYEEFCNNVRAFLADPIRLQWTYVQTRASNAVQNYKIRQHAF